MGTVNVEGLDRLKRKLRALPTGVKAEVRKTMESTAQKVVDLQVHLCPVLKEEHANRTAGALKNSIDWCWGPPPREAVFGNKRGFRVYQTGDLKLSIYCGDLIAWYPVFVEFGGGGKIQAQPFFYPGWRVYQGTMKSSIATSTRKAAQAVAASG